MNVDGSIIRQGDSPTMGGVICNPKGLIHAAFAFNIGNFSITRVELRGAIEGLKFAWNKGF
ncbi:hypothetical protein LINPERHAP1_LOCUS21442 [Linum perenne]